MLLNGIRKAPADTWRLQIQIEANTLGETWNEVKAIASEKPPWSEFVLALCSLKNLKEIIINVVFS